MSKRKGVRAHRSWSFVQAVAVMSVAAAPALGGALRAQGQTGEQTLPEIFVGMFIEGCVWTAPDFRDANLVFEREGLSQSPVVFDRQLFIGATGLVSAAIEDTDTQRRCRLVGRDVEEETAAAALRQRLQAEFGALLTTETAPNGDPIFRAPVSGSEVTIRVVLAEPGEDPRSVILATIGK